MLSLRVVDANFAAASRTGPRCAVLSLRVVGAIFAAASRTGPCSSLCAERSRCEKKRIRISCGLLCTMLSFAPYNGLRSLKCKAKIYEHCGQSSVGAVWAAQVAGEACGVQMQGRRLAVGGWTGSAHLQASRFSAKDLLQPGQSIRRFGRSNASPVVWGEGSAAAWGRSSSNPEQAAAAQRRRSLAAVFQEAPS